MKMSIYRIFDALGDSILLSTYFNHYNIKTVYYNRGDFNTLNQMMSILKIDKPEFVKVDPRIDETMVNVVIKLREDKVPLIHIESEKNPEYTTTQLGSKNESARDRNATLEELKEHILEGDIKDTSQCKTIPDLIKLLSNSKKHVSIDSGTAWTSAAMRIPTVVLSKNSYYFPDAYHYMKYMQIQSDVKVYQQTGPGLFMADEQKYYKYAKENNVAVGPFNRYLNKVLNV